MPGLLLPFTSGALEAVGKRPAEEHAGGHPTSSDTTLLTGDHSPSSRIREEHPAPRPSDRSEGSRGLEEHPSGRKAEED